MPEATQSGLSDNAAGALAYVTIIPSIIFLVMEPYNRNPFVRFHCWQNIFLCIACIALWIVDMVLAFIPFLGWIIMLLLSLGIIALWIICVVKAAQGQKFVIPVIGPLAEKQANS
ncbi:MAG TPA: DUF4870 domain-containing protein [Terracidiphilus sp.]|nr:DUF4870 domain-containing protein [Terracidiphilus sp.]